MGVKVAFIGAGYMANEHLNAFSAVSGVELSGIYNREVDKARELQEKYNVEFLCDSIEELYNKTHADIVVVCVYETAHKNILSEVAKYDWAILTEKPLGCDLSEAYEIRDILFGKEVYVGLNRRFLSSTNYVNENIQTEGKRYIDVVDNQDLQSAEDIGHDPRVVENWMYANSIHLIDYISYFARGGVKEVRNLHKWEGKKSDFISAHIVFDSGDEANYTCYLRGRPGPWGVAISTENMRYEMCPLEKVNTQAKGERTRNEMAVSDDDVSYKPGLKLQAERVIKSIQTKEKYAANIDDAIRTMELVNKIYVR